MKYKCPKCGSTGPFDYYGNLSTEDDKRHDYCKCEECRQEILFIFQLIEVREEGI